MNFLLNCIKGIFIGAGAILPGISSGVLCVIFGLYEKLLDSVLHFFKNVKQNFKFLFPIVLGGFVGVFLFGNLLNYVFYSFPIQTKSIFIGLILGSISPLLKQVHNGTSLQLRYIPFFLLALFLGILSVILENHLQLSYNLENINFLYLFICGICMSAGVIIPGVSNTIILMLLGVYGIYISAVASLNLHVLIPLGLGLIVGSYFFMKLTKFLLDNFYVQTFYAIIGFTVGSIFVLLPDFSTGFDIIVSLIFVVFGYWLVGLQKKEN